MMKKINRKSTIIQKCFFSGTLEKLSDNDGLNNVLPTESSSSKTPPSKTRKNINSKKYKSTKDLLENTSKLLKDFCI